MLAMHNRHYFLIARIFKGQIVRALISVMRTLQMNKLKQNKLKFQKKTRFMHHSNIVFPIFLFLNLSDNHCLRKALIK